MFQPKSLSINSVSEFVEDLEDQIFKNPGMSSEEIRTAIQNKRNYSNGVSLIRGGGSLQNRNDELEEAIADILSTARSIS